MSLLNNLSFEEQAAASAMSLFSKRGREGDDNSADAAGGMRPAKLSRPEDYVPPVAAPVVVAAPSAAAAAAAPVQQPTSKCSTARELKPAPYFYYRDYSMEVDDDPLTPLTPPGRVPNFPAK